MTPSATSTDAARLADLLSQAERAVVLTGAGISVPSGIPDFRTPGKGLWEKVDPMKVAHIDAFRRSPDEFWTFYGQRFAMLSEIRPNPAHMAVAELEQRGVVRGVITQNIDRLHRAAGSENVIEVHGSIEWCVCEMCGGRVGYDDVTGMLANGTPTPECATCITPLKPNVVLFGEMLPEDAMADATALAAEADLMLCIGSSLEVYPVAGLPGLTLDKGGRIALVTHGPTPYDGESEVKLSGDVVEELEAVLAALPELKPETLIILMIAALFGVGIITGGGSDPQTEPAEGSDPSVERVARRLERIRELEFKQIPPVRTISPEQAREEGLESLDEDYPPERRAADEEILTLLGLLPEGSDLRELAGTIFGEEVAGFYDDKTEEMTLVEGSGEGAEGEITLAHELTHALEDQHFGLELDAGAVDDETTAHAALVEGTATVAMLDYTTRSLTGGTVGRDQILAQLQATDLFESDSGLPPYLQRSLLFPYSAGALFVDEIGTWGPANRALRGPGPVSTEQILHPEKYRARERPLQAEVRQPPGSGWNRAASGTIGEFDTRELIRSSDSLERAERAAAGWGGGSYALWRKDGKSVLTLAWRWDTRRDAAEFAAALPRYIERTLDGRPAQVDVGPTVRLTIGPAQ